MYHIFCHIYLAAILKLHEYVWIMLSIISLAHYSCEILYMLNVLNIYDNTINSFYCSDVLRNAALHLEQNNDNQNKTLRIIGDKSFLFCLFYIFLFTVGKSYRLGLDCE